MCVFPHIASPLQCSGASTGRQRRGQAMSLNKIWPDPEVAEQQREWPLWWFSPFFDHTSFGYEAATLVLGLVR